MSSHGAIFGITVVVYFFARWQKISWLGLGDNIVITVVDVRGDKVRLGIDAPTDIPVHRQEVYDAIQREKNAKKDAAVSDTDGTA